MPLKMYCFVLDFKDKALTPYSFVTPFLRKPFFIRAPLQSKGVYRTRKRQPHATVRSTGAASPRATAPLRFNSSPLRSKCVNFPPARRDVT
ncbi:hypothetical protein EVAR_50733_1 [Eumeta japonica]|uniref:Uncharacterized protein n=1 Tax=Eumeta variegata TaxID=151549 RepID=A0A4C1YQU4_EUMVA|nr:hypothetical protein EVAR_50733_1 [Eumeta japonica]